MTSYWSDCRRVEGGENLQTKIVLTLSALKDKAWQCWAPSQESRPSAAEWQLLSSLWQQSS